jgi:hypothetical protein
MGWRKTWIRDTGKAAATVIAAVAALLIGGSVIGFIAKGGFLYERTESGGARTTIRIGGEVSCFKLEGALPPAKP